MTVAPVLQVTVVGRQIDVSKASEKKLKGEYTVAARWTGSLAVGGLELAKLRLTRAEPAASRSSREGGWKRPWGSFQSGI